MFQFFRRLFQEKENIKTSDLTLMEDGSSGIEIESGFFQEEYFSPLLYSDAADIYDKMRRNDTQIALALSSIQNAIMGGRWFIEAAKSEAIDEDEAKKHAELVEHIIFCDLDKSWNAKLKEILTCIAFGHAVFERVHKIVKDHPRFGPYIGIKKLAWRSPKTIYKWNFNKNSKEFESITQLAFGDLVDNQLQDISADDLYIFNIDSEGDNLEGISMLRQCYGSWKRKELYLKLMAIGIEKSAIGTPIGKYPSPEYGTTEYTNLKNVLKALTSHNKNFIMLPQKDEGANWDIDITKIDFDADKVRSAIDYEDASIMRRFMAQFLMLGSSGSSGSWALSTDQSDFFLNGIVWIADMISEVMNDLIIELIKLNFGEQPEYPELKHSRIKDKAGREFAEILSFLKNAGIIVADDELEDHVRNIYDLPKKPEGEEIKREPEDTEDEEPEPEVPEPTKEADEQKTADPTTILLAEPKAKKQIEKWAKPLEALYDTELRAIGDDLINQVIKNYDSAKTDLQRISAAKNIQPRNVAKYRKSLVKVMGDASEDAVQGAKIDLKSSRKGASEVELAKGEKGEKKANRYVITTSDALSETQILDLKKAIVLQFSSSIGSTEDSGVIKQDLTKKVDKRIDTEKLAAATVTSQVINKSREAIFFDDEVVDEVESFTFVNSSPVAAICKDLAGKTFASDDVESRRLVPPLHHNCKSILEPNLRGAKNNPEISDGGLQGQATKTGRASITLGEIEKS